MIFDFVYKIDWNTLHAHLLPAQLRRRKLASSLKCLLKPSKNLHTQFLNLRRKANYKIDHTPQVFSMENVLNDAFDQQERRIYIVDGIYRGALYFYNPEENKPVHFYDPEENISVYFYDPEEIEQLDVDFVVVVPQDLLMGNVEENPKIIRMRSLIDAYRLPDKTYQIKFK